MAPKILRQCDVCKHYHASYLAVDTATGTRYYCYDCWKTLKAQSGPAKSAENPRSASAHIETKPRKA